MIHGISCLVSGWILFVRSNRYLTGVLDGKFLQENPINAGVPLGSILEPTLSLLYINKLPDDAISNTATYADDNNIYSKYDLVNDLWQQLELASELEFNLWTL